MEFFCNLDFWKMGASNEVAAGKLIADLASECHVSHLVYSSLEPCSFKSGGEFPFPAFDTKAEISQYIMSKNLPYTFVKYSTYMENFFDGHTKISANERGTYTFKYPLEGAGMTLVPVHQAGIIIAKIFREKDKFLRKSIGLGGDHLTVSEMAKIFSEVTGEQAEAIDVTVDDWVGSRPRETGNMYRFKIKFEADFKDYVKQSREIFPEIMNFRQWLSKVWIKK